MNGKSPELEILNVRVKVLLQREVSGVPALSKLRNQLRRAVRRSDMTEVCEIVERMRNLTAELSQEISEADAFIQAVDNVRATANQSTKQTS